MKTMTSIICQARNINFNNSANLTIERGLKSIIPDDIISYIPDHEDQIESMRVSLELPQPRELALHKKNHPNWHVFADFVALRFEYTWKDEYFQLTRQSLPKQVEGRELRTTVALRWLSRQGTFITNRMIILLNISRPGFAMSRFSIQSANKFLFEETDSCHSHIDIIYDDQQIFEKHPLKSVSTKNCLIWGKNLSGLWKGTSKSNVEKSFSYFTYTFAANYHNGSINDYVWLIGALDAFYCETNVAINEKIKRRVPLILEVTDSKSFRKMLDQLYSERSRLIHGDMSFAANFSDPFELIDDFPFHDTLSSVGNLLYVLIGSYRYCIRKQVHAVDFVERPEPRKS